AYARPIASVARARRSSHVTACPGTAASLLGIRLPVGRRRAELPDEARDREDRHDVRKHEQQVAGHGVPIVDRVLPRFRAKPNRSAAKTAPSGFHLPRIIAASAMKPCPADISLPNARP